MDKAEMIAIMAAAIYPSQTARPQASAGVRAGKTQPIVLFRPKETV